MNRVPGGPGDLAGGKPIFTPQAPRRRQGKGMGCMTFIAILGLIIATIIYFF